MRKIKEILEFCPFCMTRHSISHVEVEQPDFYLKQNVSYPAIYSLCTISNEQWSNEEQQRKNSIRMKDAYRKTVGLLTSQEIMDIRRKYNISQDALATVLGWGKKTITRYETVSIQDRVHDDVLRKIDSDPLWFFDFVQRSKFEIDQKHLEKYMLSLKKNKRNTTSEVSEKSLYLEYYDVEINEQVGNVRFDSYKIQSIINYCARNIENLSKINVSNLLFVADLLYYKSHDLGITGLAYTIKNNIILPKGFDDILRLERIRMTETFDNDYSLFKIENDPSVTMDNLSEAEKKTLETVIKNKDYFEEFIKEMAFKRRVDSDTMEEILTYNIAKQWDLTI